MMEIIIASDIFGRTCAIEELAGNLSSNTIRVNIVDPYTGRHMNFSDEDEAYAYFQKNVGLQRYKEVIRVAIAQAGRDLQLVGFSVGASAIWAISGDVFPEKNIDATCFYGSQIRDDVNITPKIPMVLYFPRHEPHFDVPDLISQLSKKSLVTCSMVPYAHGFMNRKSRNFDETGFIRYLNRLKNNRGKTTSITNDPE